MCGIVGASAKDNVVSFLIEGLKRLEYRGYDSVGIALHKEEKTEGAYSLWEPLCCCSVVCVCIETGMCKRISFRILRRQKRR